MWYLQFFSLSVSGSTVLATRSTWGFHCMFVCFRFYSPGYKVYLRISLYVCLFQVLQSWLQGLPEDFTVCLSVSGSTVLATRSTWRFHSMFICFRFYSPGYKVYLRISLYVYLIQVLQSWPQGLPEDFTVCLSVSGSTVLATRSTWGFHCMFICFRFYSPGYKAYLMISLYVCLFQVLQSWLQGLPEDFTVCLSVSGSTVLATRSSWWLRYQRSDQRNQGLDRGWVCERNCLETSPELRRSGSSTDVQRKTFRQKTFWVVISRFWKEGSAIFR